MVRPLVAPMAEGAAQARLEAAVAEAGATEASPASADATPATLSLPDASIERIKAHSAATDNVGLFFGEDVFVAFGAVLLMQGFYAENGIVLEPLHIALWGIPTALCAFAIHATRLHRFDRRLEREALALARASRDRVGGPS